MLKSSLIAVPVTAIVILCTGFLSELCCCASPFTAVFLGLAAGALCALVEKPLHRDRALKRGAIAGAIAGFAAVPAQVLGEIAVALAIAGSGQVDISLFGLPQASATVDLWNWALNAFFAASLYGLLAAAIMTGTGAAGGAIWFRVYRRKNTEPGTGVDQPKPELPADLPGQAPDPRKMILSGVIMAGVAFVFLLLIKTNWGCLSVPAAVIIGLATGILAGNLARPDTAGRAAVFGGIAGLIASLGASLGDIIGLLIRIFLIQTPQGINSMTEGFYGMMGMADSFGAQTPAEILFGDIPIICCCSTLYLAAFIGFGALGGLLWFRREAMPGALRPAAPAQ
ncbi:MAG: hypothetical protein JW748_02210 [Anaerolineales bacterium]|nr:hypothetical protein [Anaerolineales bacterium]